MDKRKLAQLVTQYIKTHHLDVQTFLKQRMEDGYAAIAWREIAKHFPRRDAWQCRNAW
jgi:hypothetical protein